MPIPTIDPSYIPLNNIQTQLWDKLKNKPLKNGVITFYSDSSRAILKDIYQLSGSANNYYYTKISNPFRLSDIGTFQDNSGKNIVPYLYPFDSNNNLELYYVTVHDTDGNLQFDIEAIPYVPDVSLKKNINLVNLITNGQFSQQYSWGGKPIVSNGGANIAYGDWWIRCLNVNSSFNVSFPEIGIVNSPYDLPSGNPRNCCRILCLNIANNEYVTLENRFKDVNKFSDPSQSLNLFFTAKSNTYQTIPIYVTLYKNYGTEGSPSSIYKINIDPISVTPEWSNISFSFQFGSNYGNIVGPTGDDYFAIQINIPQYSLADLSFTDFALFIGNDVANSYPFAVNQVEPYSVNNSLVNDPTVPVTIPKTQNSLSSVLDKIFTATKNHFVQIKSTAITQNGNYTPSPNTFWLTVECWGGGGAGSGERTKPFLTIIDDQLHAGAGGGAGAYTMYSFSAALLTNNPLVINIGKGGEGKYANTGESGGTTTVTCNSGINIYANGGSGGILDSHRIPLGLPGLGGNSSTSGNYSMSFCGASGCAGSISGNPDRLYPNALPDYAVVSGVGGDSKFGSGGDQISIRQADNYSGGSDAYGYAAGGGGCVVWFSNVGASTIPETKGGKGAPGLVLITEYIKEN